LAEVKAEARRMVDQEKQAVADKAHRIEQEKKQKEEEEKERRVLEE